jgi:hypothetical protein
VTTGTIGNDNQVDRTNRLLRWAAIPALVYAAVMLAGLAIQPTAPGIFASGTSLTGRWLSGLNGIFTIGVALFVMRRVPDNACGPLLLFWGVGVLGWSQPLDWGNPVLTTVMSMAYLFFLFGVSFSALICLLFVFPTGHIVPRRMTGPLILGVAGLLLLSTLPLLALDPLQEIGPGAPANPFFSPFLAQYADQLQIAVLIPALLMMLAAVISLAWRYRHAAYRERQQIKFMVFGFAVLVVMALARTTLGGASVNWGSRFEQLSAIFSYMAWQAFPAIIIAFTIARYKLWDIDLVIRRTVSYAILTGLLALIYFGSIIVLQRLLAPFTGDSTLATILSTLLIAALFLPLRRRIQTIIDRRFYRRKYDAAKVLEGFAATARDETDLDRLTAELLRVIQETMEPESASIWLRPVDDNGPRTTDKSSQWREADGRMRSSHPQMLTE